MFQNLQKPTNFSNCLITGRKIKIYLAVGYNFENLKNYEQIFTSTAVFLLVVGRCWMCKTSLGTEK